MTDCQAAAFAALLLAALLAAVGYVLLRPRWRWDVGMSDTFRHGQTGPSQTHFTFPDGTVGPGDWNPITQRVEPTAEAARRGWARLAEIARDAEMAEVRRTAQHVRTILNSPSWTRDSAAGWTEAGFG